MRELSDIRAIDRLEVTTAGVRRMASQDDRDAAALASFRLAIVARQAVVYGMARMYQMLTEHSVPNVGVFRDLGEAKTWLGVE